jgi:carboxypeptidase C (cathepsin A)
MKTTFDAPRLTLSVPALLLAVILAAPGSGLLAAKQEVRRTDPETSRQKTAVAHRQIVAGGKVLQYTARAGFLSLRDETGEARARVFYVSYALDRNGDRSARPLTFAWNGGPGSPASLLHLGALGPRRAKTMDEYATGPPPYELVDNESTWLDKTDLVLVDPVGTGYSYPTKPEFGKQFWSVQGDIDSIAEFIRLYLTRYEIRNAPLFIAGESYGTLRAAGLSEALQGRGIALDGVILLSPVLNFLLNNFTPGNDLPYVLSLPSYTAAAFVHKKLTADLLSDLQQTLRQAETWAESQYATALMKGDQLTSKERTQVTADLARYTGLAPSFIEKNNLRVSMEQFARQLLDDQKRVVGHYDTRLSGKSGSPAEPYDPRVDPSLSSNGISNLIVPYLRSELGFKSDAFYAGPFGGRWPAPTSFRGDWMTMRWDWGSGPAGYVERAEALKRAMQKDRALHVFVASGYYDIATPYFSAQYTFNHMALDARLKDNVLIKRYDGGHAMYMDKGTRIQMKKDVSEFINATLAAHRMVLANHNKN